MIGEVNNMESFFFYLYDEVTKKEQGINGEAYRKMIRFCCRYSATVSFIYRKEELYDPVLESFRIDRPKEIKCSFYKLGMGCLDKDEAQLRLRFYKVCPAFCQWMKNSASGIFEWLNGWGFKNPENPIFFRADGSVLLSTVIHDGEIMFSPREGEHAEELLSLGDWIVGKRNYYPNTYDSSPLPLRNPNDSEKT